ncbi:hypothetical protein, partial [Rhodococcus jostii]|uniref:hypothetical protein n=1 Tax=Rhodococcus jostii TaxID=132919 RepID=UPI0035E5D6AF
MESGDGCERDGVVGDIPVQHVSDAGPRLVVPMTQSPFRKRVKTCPESTPHGVDVGLHHAV